MATGFTLVNSGDRQQMGDVLSNHNTSIIANTVARLPNAHVIPFLSHLVNEFQAKPNRGLELIPWIRAVMLFHMSYLMTVRDSAVAFSA
jgi:U3 small nucleolar RNA-associated protein 5